MTFQWTSDVKGLNFAPEISIYDFSSSSSLINIDGNIALGTLGFVLPAFIDFVLQNYQLFIAKMIIKYFLARLTSVLIHVMWFWLEHFPNNYWNIQLSQLCCNKIGCYNISLFLQTLNVITSTEQNVNGICNNLNI